MKIAHLKDLTGTVDGVNRDFYVPAAFLPVDPDSERLFWRGIARVKSYDDGWTVIDYATGHIEMKEAPELGDAPPALLFLQDLGDVVTGEVTPISGCVRKQTEITAGVDATRAVTACAVREVQACPSSLRRLQVTGSLSIQRSLSGKIGCD